MAKKTPGLSTAPAIKNRVQKFEFQTIPRSDIQEAPYNPRFIDDASAAKLEEVLLDKDIGLVEPLIWNRRTGHLVGGHQRIGRMDAIHEGENYEVPVAVIDVDEATERKINIQLNNPAMQGAFDVPKLELMFLDMNVSPFEVGFEVTDLTNLFPHDVVLGFIDRFIPDDAPDVANEAVMPGEPDKVTAGNTADEIAEIKDARKKHKDADAEGLRADHHFTVVFHTAEECQRVQTLLRLPPDEQFYMDDRFFEAIKKYGHLVTNAQAATMALVPPADDDLGTLDDGGLQHGPT